MTLFRESTGHNSDLLRHDVSKVLLSLETPGNTKPATQRHIIADLNPQEIRGLYDQDMHISRLSHPKKYIADIDDFPNITNKIKNYQNNSLENKESYIIKTYFYEILLE
jgi:hypothetical protein